MESSRGSPYQPLQQSQRHFRLLRLQESDTHQTQCEMKTFSLLDDDLPSWKALSYRWGEDAPEFTVHLNDHFVPVRKGLHTFLAQMIVEKQHDWYFIDALCIDQSNDSEKSSQVQQMRQIYERAEEVVVWIVYEPWYLEERDGLFWAVYDSDQDVQDTSSLSPAQLEKAVWENSYWSRLWILQEVLLARSLTIRIGSAEVEWSNILLPGPRYRYKGLPTRGLPTSNQCLDDNLFLKVPDTNKLNAHNILSYRRFRTKALRAGYHLPFHKAVEFFSMQRCSRLHDAVYGYLGLTNSCIQIDYSTPVLDLFVATLANYLLSVGLNRHNLTRCQSSRLIKPRLVKAKELTSPLLAFGLDPCEPVVHLVMLEVTRFFVPGFERFLTDTMTVTCWAHRRTEAPTRDLPEPRRNEYKYIGWICIVVAKSAASEMAASKRVDEIAGRLKELETADAVMLAPGGGGESKTYTQWAAFCRAISEQISHRFMESGEDVEGAEDDLDNESWILAA